MEDRQIRISVFPGFLCFSCVNPEKQTAERTCSISAELRPDRQQRFQYADFAGLISTSRRKFTFDLLTTYLANLL